MITLKQLDDPFEIKTLLSIDNLYKGILGIDNLYTWQPDFMTSEWYSVSQNNETVGIIVLTSFAGNCVVYHGGVFKKFRGENTPELFKATIQEIKKRYNFKLIHPINSSNKAVIRLMKVCNYKLNCTIKNGAFNNNDLLIYGED